LGKAVSVPLAHFERAMRMTTLLSGRITTQALTFGRTSGRRRHGGAAEGTSESECKAGACVRCRSQARPVDFDMLIHGGLLKPLATA